MIIFRCRRVLGVEDINLLWGAASIVVGIAAAIGLLLQGDKGVFYTEEDKPMTRANNPIAFWFSYGIGLAVAIGFVAFGIWIVMSQ
jgi:hypothetical protein